MKTIKLKLPSEKVKENLQAQYGTTSYEETLREFCNDNNIDYEKYFRGYLKENWADFIRDNPEWEQKLYWEEIEILPSKVIGIVLLTTTQYLFQKLGMQAKLDIPTNNTENALLKIKEAFQYIEKYQYCFWKEGYSFEVDRNTSLSILRQLEEEKYYFIAKDDNGNEIVLNRKAIKIFGKYLYFFNRPQEKVLPPLPILKWTGKELIAIHTENLPESLFQKGILQIEHQKGGEGNGR